MHGCVAAGDAPRRLSGHAGLLRLPEPPTAIITDCNTHGDGAAMALAHLGRLTGDNRVALVVHDGLPRTASLRPMSPR